MNSQLLWLLEMQLELGKAGIVIRLSDPFALGVTSCATLQNTLSW